jgi:fibrillarin-like rRNA methylase
MCVALSPHLLIEDKRRKLYPVLKDAKRQGKHAVLVRDKLFINGSQYFVDDTDEATHVNRISYNRYNSFIFIRVMNILFLRPMAILVGVSGD